VTEQSWDRKQGPVHQYFGLSYSSNLVLPRVLMQSMPLEWQYRMVECLRHFDTAFAGVERPAEYKVEPVEWTSVDCLNEHELRMYGVTSVANEDNTQWFYDGDEIEDWQRVVPVPAPDPLPHYRHNMVDPGPYGAEVEL
jgi:hypothetical protein